MIADVVLLLDALRQHNEVLFCLVGAAWVAIVLYGLRL